MANALDLVLLTVQYSNPTIFYIFIAAIASGVALSFLYRLDAGLLATAIISGLFFSIGAFVPYIYIPLVASLVLFILKFIGFGTLTRRVQNLINWVYLYRLSRRVRGVKSQGKNYKSE
jgi:hypothetical protein